METQKDEAAQAKRTRVSMDTQDQGTEKGAKNKASETTERPASEPPSSGPGRLKKTAMKLFGGKKGICTLPSFFGGGRSKGSGKGSSKKGLSKSKTHDGLSEAVHDPEDIVSEGTGLSLPLPESSRLPSSQSVHGSLETDSRCKRSVAGATEKAGAEKAHFVPKPKKGLKGFFSSIRVTGRESEGIRARPHEYVSSALLSHTDEVFQAPRKENAKSQDVPGPKVSSISETSLAATEKAAFKDPEKTLETFVSALLQPKPAPEASGPEELHSPETGEKLVAGELSLLFGDVTSLKSFDSLTGCGDIIAEQDMDSMTDSMALEARGQPRWNQTKFLLGNLPRRGEEMALPDDDDEEEEEEEEGEVKEEEDDDLEYLWASSQMYPRPILNPGYHPTTSPGHLGYMLLDPVRSYPGSSPPPIVMRVIMTPLHQDLRMIQVRPWELPPGDDCLYDLHGHTMETEEERLVAIQKQLLYWELQREQREAREACAQEAHTREAHAREPHTRKLMSERPDLESLRQGEVCGREAQVRETQVRQEKPIIEYQMRPLGPSVMGLVEGASGTSQTSHRGTTSAFPATASSEPDWRDFRPLEKRFEGTCSKKDQSTCLMQLFQSDAMFEPDMQEANFGGSPRRAYLLIHLLRFLSGPRGVHSNGNLFSSSLPPPMVTFDIADVERDGEGKCEENPEFHNDEDLAKHAFNNYAARFYQGYPGCEQSPSILGLPGMHPRPPPAAMALSRRSRSLDTTETLELELSNSHLTQGYMESDELSNYDWSAWAPCPLPVGPGHAWISPSQLDGPSSHPFGQAVCCISPLTMSMLLSVSGQSQGTWESKSQLARPFTPTPAHGPFCYNLQPKASQSVKARPQDVPSHSSISGGFSPALCPGQLPRIQPQPIHYGASSLDLSKEKAEQGASLPTSCSSTAMNGN
uniref:APC membrane recruitment protein 1 n=1 Tax=Capra hircus TaxID=9925 RepID=A0A452ELF0_CAPHI